MKTLLVSENQGILEIRLNRPDLRNAMSTEMIGELTQAFREASSRTDLRGILLRGEGKVFCAGADLSDMQRMVNFSLKENQTDAVNLHAMFDAIWACPLPVVALVHGAAFGGALGLIAVSDLVLVEEKTQLCFSEVKLGLVPAVISDFILRKVPVGFVAPWMTTGLVFSGGEALRMGLAHFHSDPTGLEAQKEKILSALRESGGEAIRATKKLLRDLPGLPASEARSETTRVIAERRVSAEGQEGLKAFLEKRTPSWRTK